MFDKNCNKFYLIFFRQFYIIKSFASGFKSKIPVFPWLNLPDKVVFFDQNGAKFCQAQIGNNILPVFWLPWSVLDVKEICHLDRLEEDFWQLRGEIMAVLQNCHGGKAAQQFFNIQQLRYCKNIENGRNQLFGTFSVVVGSTYCLINQDSKLVVGLSGNINCYDSETGNIILAHIQAKPLEASNNYQAASINQQIKYLRSPEHSSTRVNQNSNLND